MYFYLPQYLPKRRWGNTEQDVLHLSIGLLVGSSLVIAFAFYISIGAQTSDTEVWNGVVTGKNSERVSCGHSYQCNCRQVESCSTDSKGKRSCSTSTVCDTCYEHSYDVDWDVHTNTGTTFNIDRVDRQGVREPPRFSSVRQGDPVAVTHSYTNYRQAVPDSLFNKVGIKELTALANKVPPYPLGVYDYYKLDRVIPIGVSVPNLRQWNDALSKMNGLLGPIKQSNVTLILTNETSRSFPDAVRWKWDGLNKNDIVVIISAPNFPQQAEWVSVMSWSDKEDFKVQLRDHLQDLTSLDVDSVIQTVYADSYKLFKRKHMKEFEYLQAEIDPPLWVIITVMCLTVVAYGVGVVALIKR